MFRTKNSSLLTKPEERVLLNRVQAGLVDGEQTSVDGLQAEQTLLEHNLRLVSKIAQKWANTFLPYEDAYQEASLGVIKAGRMFDLSRNVKFATYAVMWIKQHINRASDDQGRLIRVPIHVLDKHRAMAAAEHKLRNKFGREPSDEEVADQVCNDTKLTIRASQVPHLREAVVQPLSLDAVWGDHDEGENLFQMIVDKDASEDIEQMPQRMTRDEALERVLLALETKKGKKYRDVLERRFGLGEHPHPQSLQEIADAYQASREGIRQIETRALEACRSAVRMLGLNIEDLF